MKLHVYLFLIFLVCSSVLGVGLGISPTRIELRAGEETTVWISNPNQHPNHVTLETDCSDIEIEEPILEIGADSVEDSVLAARPQSKGCKGTLMVGIAQANDSIGLLPSIQIPVEVIPSIRKQEIDHHKTHNLFEPDSLKLTVFVISTMLGLLVISFTIFIRTRRKRKQKSNKMP